MSPIQKTWAQSSEVNIEALRIKDIQLWEKQKTRLGDDRGIARGVRPSDVGDMRSVRSH